MDPKKPNKITEMVKLQQMLKKWKKLAVSPKDVRTRRSNGAAGGGGGGGFLKRTFPWTETSSSAAAAVPKGFVAVCVGEELRRFVIPMVYLSHRTFARLLRDAEEEFGFQQEGVLRIPCEVTTFEEVLKLVEQKKKKKKKSKKKDVFSSCSSEVGWLSPNTRAPMGHYTRKGSDM